MKYISYGLCTPHQRLRALYNFQFHNSQLVAYYQLGFLILLCCI